MKLRIALLWILTSGMAAIAQVPAPCPWFSSGSAEMALGGAVTTTAHSSSNWDGSCKFEHQSSTGAHTIEILVSKTDPHSCPAMSKNLKALGNEAVQCSRENAQRQESDTIAGRVRDAYFVVTMTNMPDAIREPSADARPSDPFEGSLLERVAEQVAGSLF